jgi:hypothetical protein
MTEPRKAALSLLITIFLFAVFTVASFAGIFDLIEVRFYNPSVASALSGELNHETASVEVFVTTVERWFSDSLAEPAVKRSFMVNQTSADIYERSQIFSRLHEKLDGLQWVRFIDSSGNRIHYSTWQGDLIREDSVTAVYRMYTEAAFYTPMENLLPSPSEDFRMIFDSQNERIVFSLPFYDALDAYRGLAVFSLSVSAIQNRLLADRSAGQGKIWLVAEPQGLLRGVPEDGMDGIFETVAENWQQSGIAKKVSVSAIESGGNRTRLVLLSAKTIQGIYIGNLVNENLFVFPPSLKILLLTLFFISIFLILFLIVNVRQDPMTVVQNRLKNLQIGLIKEYYEQKTDVELGQWGADLMRRREAIRADLRRGLGVKAGKKLDENINAYIDKSWNDLLAVIGGRLERTVNEEEIHLSLNRLSNTLSSLVEGGTLVQNPSATGPKTPPQEPSPDTIANVEEVEDIDVIEEMVPFVEEAEEFPSAEEQHNAALEEGEEMVPFAGSIEDLREDTAETDLIESEGITSFLEDADLDETEGMAPFVPPVKKVRPAEPEPEQIETLPAEADEYIESLADAEPEKEPALAGEPEAEPAEPVAYDHFDRIAHDVEWSEMDDETAEPLAFELELSAPFPSGEAGFAQKEGSDPQGNFGKAAQADEWDADETEEPLALDLEVLSPYSASSADKAAFNDASPLEDIEMPSISPLLYTPFSRTLPQIPPIQEGRGLAQKATLINTAFKSSENTEEQIIRELDGIAYIQKAALHPTPDEEDDLDPRMKGLVDSVLKPSV